MIADKNLIETACGFEGPEKLLEIWFKIGEQSLPLRTIDKKIWDEMLAIVNCQVLSIISNEDCDAYLLSESSMFIFNHKLMLKTCGTTKLLHAVEKVLKIAQEHCGLNEIEALFYSRKSFLFPERQVAPHGNWESEVNYLDLIFPESAYDSAGYIIGKINGDHWNLYVCTPIIETVRQVDEADCGEDDDVTLEILMTELDQEAMKAFWRTEQELAEAKSPENQFASKHQFKNPRRLYKQTGISGIYPESIVDDYVFDPCGYSANGLLGPYYWTIHVTPEDICSYASFETTIPVKSLRNVSKIDSDSYSNFIEVIEKVISVFKPGKFSTALFVRHSMKSHLLSFQPKDSIKGFIHRDRITHSLGKWELIFSHYERRN